MINTLLLDEYTYTILRLARDAIMHAVILIVPGKALGNCLTMVSITLLMYLVGFSLAYTVLDAGFGALILFTSVTLTMVVRGLLLGQRLSDVQWALLVVALIGQSVLLSPVLSDISWPAIVAMMISGLGWEHIVYMVQSSEREAEEQRKVPQVAISNVACLCQ